MRLQIRKKGGVKVKSPVVERIQSIIDENFDLDISLGDIAKTVGISVWYMSHILKKSTGMTVVEYRTLRRIEKAKHELLNSDRSVTEIAFSCGFSGQGYFSERFTKIVGVSPTLFRSRAKHGKT